MSKAGAPKFNSGKPYHGSSAVEGGKLKGQTDTDYFYFLCPRCADNTVLQILDYDVVKDGPVEYAPEDRTKAKRDFILVFQIYCTSCKLSDFVKLSNTGWQVGKLTDQLLPPGGIY